MRHYDLNGNDITGNHFDNCEIANEPRETVRAILDNIDAIQKETKHELSMIADAVYRGRSVTGEGVSTEEQVRNEPIIIQYARQRDTAEEILKAVVQIREALW